MLNKKKHGIVSIVLIVAMMMTTLSGCASKGKSYDVVVIGAGAAGLAAAIEAAENGASVAVLEKLPMAGGSTLLSAGIIYATGANIHKDAGVEDSVDDLVAYWSERAEGNADEAMLRLVAEKSGETINWLVDEMGVQFIGPMPMGTSFVPRAVMATEGGHGIISPMKSYAEDKKVEFFMETTAKELITNKNGDVVGVKALDKDKKEITFNAKAVILATGGFDRNDDLMNRYAKEAVGGIPFVATGNTGDGLLMAEKVDAAVVGNGSVIGFKAVEGEANIESEVSSLMWSPYLLVNKEGQRFINESTDYPIVHKALLEITDQKSFLIFDATTYNPLLDKAVEKGSAYVADTLEELAGLAGIDQSAFVTTVNEYNQMIESGVDTQFGKDLTQQTKIETGKFYAVKIVPGSIGTMTGLKTNATGQVLNNSNNVIPNLYAAGEVANGSFFYKVYPASGTSIQVCITMGRIAGEEAAKNIK